MIFTKIFYSKCRKDCNAVIDGRNIFNCNWSRRWLHKLIAIDLSKQQNLDTDPKAIPQINFTGNLEKKAAVFFITEKAKEAVLDFSKGTVKF